MSQTLSIKHPLEKHILDQLATLGPSRFIDLRPPQTETNSLAYHLKRLLHLDLITKKDELYKISRRGLSVLNPTKANRHAASSIAVRVGFVVQNGEGDILLEKADSDSWTLPGAGLAADAASLKHFAAQLVCSKFSLDKLRWRHAGMAYVRQIKGTEVIETEIVHVFKFDSDDVAMTADLMWARPHKLDRLKLAPGTQEIITRAFFNDPFFFEEFEVPSGS